MKWKEDRQSININLRGRLKQLSLSAEEFADEIIANLFNENYPFTEKINNVYNLKKVMDELIEKGESTQGETRDKIIARLRQMKVKNNGYQRNAWSLSKMI